MISLTGALHLLLCPKIAHFLDIICLGIQCFQHDKSAIKFKNNSPQNTTRFFEKVVGEGDKVIKSVSVFI